jgi:ABC-type sugar transport system ATPase subunit
MSATVAMSATADDREMAPPLLEVADLTRRFHGVVALDHVDFDVRPGEIHALVGENGAGKSTLINIIGGVLQPTAGSIRIEGHNRHFPTPTSAQEAGLSVIFQEFNLLPHLSVAENIYINREPTRGPAVDWRAMNRGSAEVLRRLGVAVDPRIAVDQLSVAQQQLVEIARALSFKSRVIVMDEPTASLSDREADRLLEIVRDLAAEGTAIIYVSHRLAEVLAVAHRVTVLRDGRRVFTRPREGLDEPQLVAAMVGRDLVYTTSPHRVPGELRLRVRDLAVDRVEGVSFDLHAGEVVGLAGLMGSGTTEIVEGLFGLRPFTAEEVLLNGQAIAIHGPREALQSGFGYVPEDRKRKGLLPDLPIKHNISLGVLRRMRRLLFIDGRRDRSMAEEFKQRLNIRCHDIEQEVSGLSGGNQQKVILARALASRSRVLMLAEPTRGVDVGAKQEIYALIDALVADGMAVLLQTSELPELIRLANRCVVMANGIPQGELAGSELTQEAVMTLATRFSV